MCRTSLLCKKKFGKGKGQKTVENKSCKTVLLIGSIFKTERLLSEILLKNIIDSCEKCNKCKNNDDEDGGDNRDDNGN